jgi:hypothetical protein
MFIPYELTIVAVIATAIELFALALASIVPPDVTACPIIAGAKLLPPALMLESLIT